MTTDRPSVVVGYDASENADRGLDWAAAYARERHLPVTVYASSGDLDYLPEWTADKRSMVVDGWLSRAQARLSDAGVTDIRLISGSGRIVPDLIDASKTAQLMVLGAQGHSALGGMLVGSVSQHLTRHAHCPVVVVRGDHCSEKKRVVVGVDGSEHALRALEFAFDYASWTGSTLVAAHGRGLSMSNGPLALDLSESEAEGLEEGKRMVAEMTAGLREKYPDVHVEVEVVPMPGVRVLADASAGASLLVVGSRGRGGFLGLLLGSVSASVLTHAPCPVAVIR